MVLRTVDSERRRRIAERAHAPAQSRGKDLLELGQCADRRLLDPGDRLGGGRAQADRRLTVGPERLRLRTGVRCDSGRRLSTRASSASGLLLIRPGCTFAYVAKDDKATKRSTELCAVVYRGYRGYLVAFDTNRD